VASDGGRPERVALFVTCLVDLLFPEVGEATVSLLDEAGIGVDFPASQVCCGQPAFNSGFVDDARRMGRTLLDAFDDAEAVVSPSGSCAAMVRSHFPHLFEGTSDHERAAALASKTYELTEFLVDVCGTTSRGSLEARVTYHDSCHGLRELHLTGQGRALLSGVEDLELVEMTRSDACCGFGGTFSVRLPEMAETMADDKLDQAASTAADYLVAGDSGCLMHLAGRAARRGDRARPVHLAVLLAEARGLS
jgi:L-lactate dehydrogenase complex protein LldE